MLFRILLLLILFSFDLSTIASAEAPLTAAFIRDHQLWIKKGDQEIQLTKNRYVYNQKWSYDGRFIGYIDGDEKGEKSDLFIYDTREKESYQPYVRVVTSDFKWSPINNQLAYNDQGLLNVTKTKNGRPQGYENVSLGVSGFEWFPNGKEFIVASQSSLLPTGWGPIPLYRIPVDANLAKDKIKPFYTIQTKEPYLFGIDADYFKWSSDGKWVSFLIVPTASWSMDSNTLGVLSSQGKHFQPVGKMLGFKDWFKWAPLANQLAYISGEGRFFVENKKMTIAEIPTSKQQKEYTPEGFVDLDLEWFSKDLVIVARAKENKEWKEGPVPSMFTSLYSINIRTGEQKQTSFPRKNELDEDPQVVRSYLTLFRRKAEDFQGDVWVKDGISGQEYLWIKNVDSAPVFYNPN
ncbi:translocation protein TolB [Peribacillus muralis]|uniref:translocation protein TolB n=1 Tax=Peribacillus muralis TaxID=264697 RepID=UPI001F4E8A70|nr:translocation protein TolB [Peribacillus muralis]MCK1995296.1 translocation protein TolB [Peribacillus muralis]MCK2015948.1 translocation protein TolB [Peribacillus muralis]